MVADFQYDIQEYLVKVNKECDELGEDFEVLIYSNEVFNRIHQN